MLLIKLLYYGKDYPLGYDYFRKRLNKAFLKHRAISSEIEIQKQLDKGEFVIKEIDALYKLRKYRHLKKSYYEDTAEKDMIELLKKKDENFFSSQNK